MATSRAPKNDFAPAWLKIPTEDSAKAIRKHDGKVVKDERHDSGNGPLQKQRSFDSYEDRRRPNPRHRHNSVEDDFYSHPYPPYSYFPAYGFDKYGSHFRSQPVLYRPQFNPRDGGKYQHPNARFSQVPGAGPFPYYDYPPYEFYGDPTSYYNSYVRSYNGRHHPPRDKNHDKKSKLDDHDFPSLNGEDTEKKDSSMDDKKTYKSGGVWDAQRKGDTGGGVVDNKASVYKALVANKSHVKKHRLANGHGSREHVINGTTSSKSGKENREIKESAPSIDSGLLNTRFVTQPKTIGDKKSDFLKALRNEDINRNKSNIQQNGDLNHENGETEELSDKIDHLKVSCNDGSLLSSSLEAEQRLLREMGWTEDDDDEEYVITEDDMKEFQNLSKQVKEQYPKFELNKATLTTASWSPQHITIPSPQQPSPQQPSAAVITVPPPPPPAGDDDTSSLDSDDSDDDR